MSHSTKQYLLLQVKLCKAKHIFVWGSRCNAFFRAKYPTFTGTTVWLLIARHFYDSRIDSESIQKDRYLILSRKTSFVDALHENRKI